MRSIFLPQRSRVRAFTLVELLTVMAVISILIGVSVPALKGLQGSGGRKSAVRTLMGVMDQARMLAISDGKSTYVVFAGKPLDGKGALAPSMVGRAYAVFEDSASFMPVQRSNWEILPVGVAFKISDGSNDPTAPTAVSSITNRKLPIDGAASDPNQQFAVTSVVMASAGDTTPDGKAGLRLPYIKFDPSGAVDSAIADANPLFWRVLVFEGVVTSTGVEQPTRPTGSSAAQQALLFDEVRINPATGRARYTVDPANNLILTSA